MEIQFGDKAAHLAALQEVVSAANPDSEIQVLNGGESSSVIRVGDLLYKSPHSGVGNGSSVVRFEAAVADALPETARLATGAVLTMPQLVATHPDEDLPYNKLRFVPGDILTMPAIKESDEATKTQLGRDLGSFVVWLAKTIPTDKFNDIHAATPTIPLSLTDALRIRLPYVDTMRSRGCSNTADLLEELTSTPPPPYQDSVSDPRVTGHGDLRPANLTFQDGRLKGVFDFGLLLPADPAEELRFTSFMGEATAEAAIRQFYRETQILIPRQRLEYYASAHVMHSASFCAIYGTDKMGGLPPLYRNYLHQQYPNKDWSELDSL